MTPKEWAAQEPRCTEQLRRHIDAEEEYVQVLVCFPDPNEVPPNADARQWRQEQAENHQKNILAYLKDRPYYHAAFSIINAISLAIRYGDFVDEIVAIAGLGPTIEKFDNLPPLSV